MTPAPASAPVVRRLGPSDIAEARRLFLLMAEVFENPTEPLSDAWLARLLGSEAFWALAACLDGELVGGLTAHTLPMTMRETTEVFIYDVAVREDRQRRGVGRALMETICGLAAAAGAKAVFVPADNEDTHALDFYRAVGGDAAPVTIFTFEDDPD